MIKKISSMVLVFLCLTLDISARERDRKDNEVQEPPLKKTTINTAISINLSLREDSRKEFIVKIDLSFNDHLDNVNFLLAFPNLTDLSLRCCPNLKDNYRPISQLTNLEILDLFGTCLTTTEYLIPLVKLKSLKISCTNLVRNIDCLTHLKLKDLDIEGEVYVGLIGLSRITSLESIVFSNFYRESRQNNEEEFPQLYFLTPLVNLRALSFQNNTFITHINPLITLPNLTSLDLSGCLSIVDLKCIGGLKSLTEINLSSLWDSYIPTLTEDLSSLTSLTNLRNLTIDESINIPDKLSPIVKVTKKSSSYI